jgi:hypothetical protein
MRSRKQYCICGGLFLALLCFLALGPVGKIGNDAVADQRPTQRSYDLTPRYQKGQTSFYRMTQTVYFLSEAAVLSRTRQSADFKREVVEVREDGSAVERITWRHYAMAVGQGRKGALGEPERPPWTEDFSYLFSAEDSHEDFHWDYSAIPVTAMGDGFMTYTINAHFEFDFLRSRAHGAIEQLRRVGDSVLVPDTDHPFDIRLRATPQAWTCIKRDHTLTFQGLSECGGHPCAVLEFWTWLDVVAHLGEGEQKVDRQGFTQFDGHLYVDLRDGSLWKGDFNESVTLPILGATGKEVSRLYVEYRIERVSAEVFRSTD